MKKNGFTLLELLSSIIVCSFLLFFSLVSLIQFKQKGEGLRIVSDIKAAVRYAKIQAMGSSTPLQLSSKDWSKGMVLTSTRSSNKLIQQWSWESKNWEVRWLGANGLTNIVISGSVASAMSNGQFVITNQSNGEKIILVLNRLGRIRQL